MKLFNKFISNKILLIDATDQCKITCSVPLNESEIIDYLLEFFNIKLYSLEVLRKNFNVIINVFELEEGLCAFEGQHLLNKLIFTENAIDKICELLELNTKMKNCKKELEL
jgi:hypothetical protein